MIGSIDQNTFQLLAMQLQVSKRGLIVQRILMLLEWAGTPTASRLALDVPS